MPRNLTSARFLEAWLQELLPERKVEVVNLGVAAVASFPVRKLAEQALDQLQPDLLLLYGGHNEFYGALGPVQDGRLLLSGTPYAPRDPRHGRDRGLGFVAAERQREGIVPDLDLSANTTLPFIERFCRWGALSSDRETDHTAAMVSQLQVRASSLNQPLRQLSGGNQQKICLGRWLVEGIALLIVEEPTRGVDLGARRQLYLTLRQWTAKGLAVLLVSTDAEEIAGLCDRCMVLDRGKVTAHFDGALEPANLVDAALNAATKGKP